MATKKFNGPVIMKWLNARHIRERVVLLGAGLGIITMLWLTFVHDALGVAKENASRNITIAESQIIEEQNRQAAIRGSYTSDPNSFALSRQRELREAAENADARLNQLYGDLISPQQMAQVLTTVLQNETTLNFIRLENIAPETLIGAATTDASATAIPDIQVFRHGFRLAFEGSFLETVYYLRNIERLDVDFFWEDLKFELLEYPNARIDLEIYTLSTEREWIGV